MNKAIRKQVFEKYGGRCAYCGCELKRGWHIDHIEPVYRGTTDEELESWRRNRGADGLENYNPACARCNINKSTYTVEQFRKHIADKARLLRDYNNNYRIALAYGVITETEKPVVFHFETIEK